MTFTRMTLIACPIALLAACGGGGDLEVRDTPQAVHPSPYPLAQGVVAETSAPTCAHHGHKCHHQHHHHHHKGNDGSRPIVD